MCLANLAHAQTPFMRHIETQRQGEGRIIVVQDDTISTIVNTRKAPTPNTTEKNTAPSKSKEVKLKVVEKKIVESPSANTAPSNYTNVRQRYKATGYRVQVFTGGNSRNDKIKAQQTAENIRKEFPELSVYPQFTSPRWICRVGDFRNAEDAQKYVRLIRNARLSNEARVVKCTVLLAN